ncbi:DUF982 domain-containing protein [Mesorhizobium sp. Root552]|uniref:DUF982 domain-containing protein n=1 Tax=Mesorhizobium sp. Root552 TaxID=1736555 RepID=UPI000B04062E|nr:DUF982 domain-containing protein [Mesorhizobium sp. Root552]
MAAEVIMKLFSTSIWVKDVEFGVRPLGSLEEAQLFLDEWPQDRRGPFYYLAAQAIGIAQREQIRPDEARDALVAFLENEGILAEATIVL